MEGARARTHNNMKRSTLQAEPRNTGTLDGSAAQLSRFLRELIAMSGQESDGVPMLELQLGEILTRTTLPAPDGADLLISALLPPCGDAGYSAQSSEEIATQAALGIEFLWHVDAGRYIGVRKVPIAKLPDERSVLDAILTTSDQAAAWFAARCEVKAAR